MQPGGGWRAVIAERNAASVSSVSMRGDSAQPTTLRDQASKITARYTKPKAIRM